MFFFPELFSEILINALHARHSGGHIKRLDREIYGPPLRTCTLFYLYFQEFYFFFDYHCIGFYPYSTSISDIQSAFYKRFGSAAH